MGWKCHFRNYIYFMFILIYKHIAPSNVSMKLTYIQWILGPLPSSFKLAPKGLCTSTRTRQPIRGFFSCQSRYKWCMPIKNTSQIMFIKIIYRISRRFDKGKFFRSERRSNILLLPILHFIWYMTCLLRKGN